MTVDQLDRMLLWFTDPDATDVSLTGGKGASLSRMTNGGLPVPPGFVIRADLLSCMPGIKRALEHLEEGNADFAQEAVREAARVPREVIDAYEELGGVVAVRSSACAEDGADASYAGQQDTFLGVEGTAAVERAIVDCWASFFSPHAVSYRRLKGDLSDLGMAVVVQRMIEPEKAGVAFTHEPVRGRRDRMLVEAVPGRGEALVSGEVIPDQYTIKRDGTLVRERLAFGGTLTPDDLRRIAELGLKAEALFGGPQDIEWVIVDSEVSLVQSRPITTLR